MRTRSRICTRPRTESRPRQDQGPTSKCWTGRCRCFSAWTQSQSDKTEHSLLDAAGSTAVSDPACPPWSVPNRSPSTRSSPQASSRSHERARVTSPEPSRQPTWSQASPSSLGCPAFHSKGLSPHSPQSLSIVRALVGSPFGSSLPKSEKKDLYLSWLFFNNHGRDGCSQNRNGLLDKLLR